MLKNRSVRAWCGAVVLLGTGAGHALAQNAPWLTTLGHGEHANTHIVLVSGDEEYRSEEALPQLAQILSCRHGFTTTVLFAIDPETGEVNPDVRTNIPGLEALVNADLMIIATRFRDLPDNQMRYVDMFVLSGKPIIGLRTATHAFNLSETSTFRDVYTWNSQAAGSQGGFGRQILGETWIAHHGGHGTQATLGIVDDAANQHPIARGLAAVEDAHEPKQIWGPTDVYRVRLPLPSDATPIVLGAVQEGMQPESPIAKTEQNTPMMPIAWTREMEVFEGETRRVFTTTMGAATDLVADGTRTMLVNGVFWALGLEDQIPPTGAASGLVGTFEPTDFGFGGFVPGRKPRDYKLDCNAAVQPTADSNAEPEAAEQSAAKPDSDAGGQDHKETGP